MKYVKLSTSGYCSFVGGNLVTWRSKKQNVVARSNVLKIERGVRLEARLEARRN